MGIALDKVAINQATTREQWDFRQSVEGYRRHGVPWLALWRDKVAEIGLKEAVRIIANSGIKVSGYNRLGAFADPHDRAVVRSETLAVFDEAEALGAPCVLYFPGDFRLFAKELGDARRRLGELVFDIAEITREHRCRLALEPLHPMLAADRSPLNTLAQANDLCDMVEGVGVVIDVYHLWWDPALDAEIARCGKDRLLGFHVSDWRVPTRDLVFDRAMMGDGVIDIPHIRQQVERAGYMGPVEVEIFSREWWQRDPDEVIEIAVQRCGRCV